MYNFSKTRKTECVLCKITSTLIFSAMFYALSPLLNAHEAGHTYLYGDISVGSTISTKLPIDGDMPAWIELGVEYETGDRLFSVRTGVKHRSNADISGFNVDGKEYSLDSIFVGAKYRFKVK